MLKLILIGNATREPEARTVHTQTGEDIQVASITLAMNDNIHKEKPATFIRASVWRKAAEVAIKHVHKGDKICITADNISVHTFAKNDGSTGTMLECNATELELLGGRRGDADDTGMTYTPPVPQPQKPQQMDMTQVEDDSDLPF